MNEFSADAFRGWGFKTLRELSDAVLKARRSRNQAFDRRRLSTQLRNMRYLLIDRGLVVLPSGASMNGLYSPQLIPFMSAYLKRFPSGDQSSSFARVQFFEDFAARDPKVMMLISPNLEHLLDAPAHGGLRLLAATA